MLVQVAKRNYHRFLVPTNLVESKKSKRYYTEEQQADLDIRTSVNKIGEIINLSQELQSYMWDQLNHGASFEDIRELYYDACKLSVMSGIEIDKAKKEFAVKNEVELDKLRKKWLRKDEEGRTIKPYFFGHVAMTKGFYDSDRKNYMHHATAMDYLEELVDEYRSPTVKFDKLSLVDIIDFPEYNYKQAYYEQMKRILDDIRDFKRFSLDLWNGNSELENNSKFQIYNQKRAELIEKINFEYKPNIHTLYLLLRQLEKDENKQIKGSLVDILFSIKNEEAFQLIKQSQGEVAMLRPDPDGEVELFGIPFARFCRK